MMSRRWCTFKLLQLWNQVQLKLLLHPKTQQAIKCMFCLFSFLWFSHLSEAVLHSDKKWHYQFNRLYRIQMGKSRSESVEISKKDSFMAIYSEVVEEWEKNYINIYPNAFLKVNKLELHNRLWASFEGFDTQANKSVINEAEKTGENIGSLKSFYVESLKVHIAKHHKFDGSDKFAQERWKFLFQVFPRIFTPLVWKNQVIRKSSYR